MKTVYTVGVARNAAGPQDNPYSDMGNLRALIRRAVRGAGFAADGAEHAFAGIVKPGMRVLLKPNWVLHLNKSGATMDCMVTHPAFIRAAIAELLPCQPAEIIVGDAPIQGCDWDALLPAKQRERTCAMADGTATQIRFLDFRRTVVRDGDLSRPLASESRPASRYVVFDLGRDSLLEPLCRSDGPFRAPCYDRRELAKSQCLGTHKYCLAREPFEVDRIIALPKLKTHKKTGLTCALKNLVGLNGDKGYLAHNRVGGPARGGDSYPSDGFANRLAEYFFDRANQIIGRRRYKLWEALAALSWRFAGADRRLELDGNWHGNDTCWRMVLDLNRTLLYGRADGALGDRPQRSMFSLVDGLIAGQCNGPLAPEPIGANAVCFSDSSVAADSVGAALLRLNPDRMPLLREAFGDFRWPLIPADAEVVASVDGTLFSLSELAVRYGVDATPAPGWVGHVEWTELRNNRRQ